MKRVIFVAVAAMTLGGCSSSWFSTDWLPTGSISGSPVPLALESEPPGAEARTSAGQTCRTPCALALPASGDIAVTFSLAGYQPQTIPVKLMIPGDPRADPDAVSSTEFRPNPVVAALEPAPQPAQPARKQPTKPKARAAAKPAPAPAPAQRAPAPAAAPSATPGMIPGSVPTTPPPGSPWPPLQQNR
jgi:hypothetical protein